MYLDTTTEETIKKLHGQRITAVSLDKYEVRIEVNSLTILIIKAEGDCCSHSHFEFDDDLKKNLLYKNFYSIEEIDKDYIIKPDGNKIDTTSKSYRNGGPDEQRLTYFLDIKTSGGVETLTMHNDSNGYYGGNFSIEFDSVIRDILQ